MTCTTAQCSTSHHTTLHHSTSLHSVVQQSAVQCSAVRGCLFLSCPSCFYSLAIYRAIYLFNNINIHKIISLFPSLSKFPFVTPHLTNRQKKATEIIILSFIVTVIWLHEDIFNFNLCSFTLILNNSNSIYFSQIIIFSITLSGLGLPVLMSSFLSFFNSLTNTFDCVLLFSFYNLIVYF